MSTRNQRQACAWCHDISAITIGRVSPIVSYAGRAREGRDARASRRPSRSSDLVFDFANERAIGTPLSGEPGRV
jgi:hypothetical protein